MVTQQKRMCLHTAAMMLKIQFPQDNFLTSSRSFPRMTSFIVNADSHYCLKQRITGKMVQLEFLFGIN